MTDKERIDGRAGINPIGRLGEAGDGGEVAGKGVRLLENVPQREGICRVRVTTC